MQTSGLLDSIGEAVARRRLLDHPFYSAWSRGSLRRDALKRYAEQYFQWVAAFPTFLSATHANCADLATRQTIVENLVDEEMGPSNHSELWLRFCDALQLEREAVRCAEALPETRRAIRTFDRICRASPAVAALAAIYAYEVQQPEVMKFKRQGLAALYAISDGHDYFEVHERLDVEHSTREGQQIERLGAGREAEILEAVQSGLDATYVLLDGVERIRHEQLAGGL
jgi:pyrroloquinoline-quinone synthase